VQVNARVDYAVRAVVEVAIADGIVRKKELSDRQDIPERFLENILAQLVRTGILVGTRGPQGGYALGRDAASVSVADIVRAIDGPLAAVRGVPPERLEYADAARPLKDVWIALRASIRAVLEETTIQDIVNGSLPSEVTSLLDQPGAWERR
jgi:Rrf2 family protein